MDKQSEQTAERRPIATRESGLAQRAAAWLVARHVSPNAISMSSIVFALGAFGCLLATQSAEQFQARILFFLSAVFVQLRLLANLFDGMVAVGSGQSSKTGELYNEIPDRVADSFILIGAGYAIGGVIVLGYSAALMAVFVAYLRAIGNTVGAGQLFLGPMAKPHRMATVTVAALYLSSAPARWPAAIESETYGAMSIALIVIIAGCFFTAVRRIVSTSRQLRAGS